MSFNLYELPSVPPPSLVDGHLSISLHVGSGLMQMESIEESEGEDLDAHCTASDTAAKDVVIEEPQVSID